jgi:hypothetical protein
MVNRPTNLDDRRGMKERAAAELRRMHAEVEADQAALRERRDALETLLAASPSANWHEAAEKARYLLGLFAQTPHAMDLRRQKLINDLLADFARLLEDEPLHPL